MFVEIRITSKINEINGASESEEETNGDLARRANSKNNFEEVEQLKRYRKNLK